MDRCCDRKRTLNRRALILSWATILYNVGEGIVSIAFGAAASSIALIGFGLDSFVESFSGVIMVWRFAGNRTEEEERRVERRATTLVGWSFFLLAAYVVFESAKKLLTAEAPDPSLPGIIIALVSLVTMPTLYLLKTRTGRAIGSTSLLADSKQTLACCFLSVALLAGLGLNKLLGLWPADPIAGLFIAAWLVREGIQTLRTRRLCC